MPTRGLTLRPETNESRAVAIATPADGPSFGWAPAGMCKWISDLLKNSSLSPRFLARERTKDNAARADSFITFPMEPVTWKPLPPGMLVASTNKTSPPYGVHARPGTTPGIEVRWLSSSLAWKMG